MSFSGDTLLFFFVILTLLLDVRFELESLLFFFLILVILQEEKPRKKAKNLFWLLTGINFSNANL
ncbi:hypothetical protein VTU32_10200 [Thermoanaerobacter sp. CM-CNRG TB177]|jgi:hypothetical protein|uniref:hypothetical protein n=1 Tax=Thermoanaerobacter sp. CM-CNRG TB177 TaxID=2800659 RepID=UPI001BDEC291|nr:hypothetical protein [Thermoanaerobacter sp. CM-CNRG TB177]MBT1278599.1 hypothetical protein [Thermoanaerobacter sp. CM-CNRG TB177]